MYCGFRKKWFWWFVNQGWSQVLSKLLKYFISTFMLELSTSIMVFLTTVLKNSYMFVNVYLSISKSTILKGFLIKITTNKH